MRRRLMLVLIGSLGLGLMVGCGAGFVAALQSLYGSWSNGAGYMSIHQPGAQPRQSGDQLEIYYPAATGQSDWYLVGSAVKSGNTWSGTFEVMSGPTTRQSGPLVVGNNVTVQLNLTSNTALHSTISATGATSIVANWTKVVD
ncbi:MAG: hypothetical protein HZB16_17230 [Armatimonadetes bacterium]|nr:hypothetical protein [Armatimonadota bacterium]